MAVRNNHKNLWTENAIVYGAPAVSSPTVLDSSGRWLSMQAALCFRKGREAFSGSMSSNLIGRPAGVASTS
jgi:hypothetical protein